MVEGIKALIMLSDLIQNAMEAQKDVQKILKDAQENGRDLTNHEIEQIKSLRDEAVQEWNEVKGV